MDTSEVWTLGSLTRRPMALIDFGREPAPFPPRHRTSSPRRRARACSPGCSECGGRQRTGLRCWSCPLDVRSPKAPVESRTALDQAGSDAKLVVEGDHVPTQVETLRLGRRVVPKLVRNLVPSAEHSRHGRAVRPRHAEVWPRSPRPHGKPDLEDSCQSVPASCPRSITTGL